jgi:hypothetical protein
MGCPACGSKEWKSASLVYEEGTQATRSEGTGVGIGVGAGGVGVGAGRFTSNGTQQSYLARAAAPPKVPFDLGDHMGFVSFLLALLVIGVVLIGTAFDPFSFWQFVIGLGVVAISITIFRAQSKSSRQNSTNYSKTLKRWSTKKMCTQCGVFYH